MKKLLGIILLQAFFATCAYAQFDNPDPHDAGQVKGKILALPLLEEVTRTLVDLGGKPDELKAYKDGVAKFNEDLKEAAKVWKLGKNVEFLTPGEIKKAKETGNSRYAIVEFQLRNGTPINMIDSRFIGPVYGSGTYNSEARNISRGQGFGQAVVLVPASKGEVNTVMTIYLPVAYPSRGDMMYTLEMIEGQYNKVLKNKEYKVNEFKEEVDHNNNRLAKKTLLIDQGQLKGKITAADLKKAYPYNLEVVDYTKIDEVIFNRDSNYAYVQIVPYEPFEKGARGKTYHLLHLVVNASDADVLGKSKPTRMNYTEVANDITKREVKDYKM